MPISEPTAVFSIRDDRDMEIKQAVLQVYRALEEKGYNPINQLVGYILSEDPTYITTYKNARAIIRRIDRDDLLQALVRDFVKHSRFGKKFPHIRFGYAGMFVAKAFSLGRRWPAGPDEGESRAGCPSSVRFADSFPQVGSLFSYSAKNAFCTAFKTAARPAVKLTPPCR